MVCSCGDMNAFPLAHLLFFVAFGRVLLRFVQSKGGEVVASLRSLRRRTVRRSRLGSTKKGEGRLQLLPFFYFAAFLTNGEKERGVT